MSVVATRSVPVARPSFGVREEQAVIDALRTGWVSQGPRVAEFERKFARYVGAAEADQLIGGDRSAPLRHILEVARVEGELRTA